MKFLKGGEISEYTIQKMVVSYLNLLKVGHAVIKIDNEGSKGRGKAGLGLRPGASDIFIARGRHGKFGFWLELKSKKGVLKPNQLKFFEDMERENYYTAVAWSFDEAKDHIDWYLLEKD